MSSKELKLTAKQENFLFRNLFAHDPSHDFNPGSNTKRLASLNALSERLFNQVSVEEMNGEMNGGGIEDNKTAKSGVNVEKMRSKRSESVQQNSKNKREQMLEKARESASLNDVDNEFFEISKYQGFENSGVFTSLAKSGLSIIPNLCNSAGLDVEDMMGSIVPNTGIITRGKAMKRRQMIEFVQKQIDFYDRLRLFVMGFEGNELEPYEDDKNAMIMSGGKLGAETSIVPRFIPLRKNIPLEKDLEESFSKKLNIGNNDVKTKPLDNDDDKSSRFISEITNIFYTIDNEILTLEGSSDEDFVQYKAKLQSIYKKLKEAILFYHNYVDAALPMYAILNTFFVEETLFTCCLDTMLESSNTYFSSEDSPEDQYNKFKSLYNIHYKNPTKQQGGGVKTTKMFHEFQDTLPMNEMVDTEFDKYHESKGYDLNGMSQTISQKFDTFFNEMEMGDLENEFQNHMTSKLQEYAPILEEHVTTYHSLKEQNARETRYKQVDSAFRGDVTQFYNSVMGYLLKLMKATNIVNPFDANIKKEMSPQGKEIANKFLQTLCRGVLDNTRPQYVQTRQQRSDGFEDLYETERESLKFIADNGKVRSALDSSLFQKFNELMNKDYASYFVKNIRHGNASEDLYNRYKNYKLYVINNAMTTQGRDPKTKIVNELYMKQNIESLCPISSVIDAQGTMGSCTKGRESSNFISSPINISIEGPGMEMGITMPLAKKKGQHILTYYASYGDLFISDSKINAVISNGITNILSANNTFKSLLEHIELTFQNRTPTWTTFENIEQLQQIIRVASKKMMGDFLQELNAIVENGGFVSIVPQYNKTYYILLTNGDQPSTVRAAYLLLHDETEGINPNAAVTFITTAQGYLYRKNTMLGGRNKKKTLRRKSKKGKKTVKTNRTTLKNRGKKK